MEPLDKDLNTLYDLIVANKTSDINYKNDSEIDKTLKEKEKSNVSISNKLNKEIMK